MEWYEGPPFWAHIVIFGVIIMMSLIFNLVYRRKTDPLFIVIMQVGIPLGLMSVMELIFFNWAFLLFDFFVTLILYGAFNHFYFWFNMHRKFLEEKIVQFNFDGQEPDTDPFCRTYESRTEIATIGAYEMFERHYDVINRYAQAGFLRTVIEDFYTNLHPEQAAILTEKPDNTGTGTEPPKDAEARKQWEDQQIKISQQITEWEKAHFLKIMHYIFEGWILHIIYVQWQWLTNPKAAEDRDLHGFTKIYLLSINQKLPKTLIINNILYYEDEIEDGKTFTCTLGVEGIRSMTLLKKMTTLEANLDIFRLFPTFAVLERIERKLNYYRIKDQNTVADFEELARAKVVFDTRIQRNMPVRKQSLLAKIKERAEGE